MTPPDRSATEPAVRAVSFDLFGTLVERRSTSDPAEAVAEALRDRGVSVPADWRDRYGTVQFETEPGAERSLYDHVEAALGEGSEADGVTEIPRQTIESAVDAAFEPSVETVENAVPVVRAVGERVPVGVLSNSSVPGLAERAIARSALSLDDFDAIVTSVDCGWRKPDPRAFEAVAESLEVDGETLLHVGDDSEADGGIEAVGGYFVSVNETSLDSISERLGGDP